MLTLAYDALNAVIWLPAGSGRLRSKFVDELQIAPRSRVLELGCGTGQVTKALVARGADVVAVDRSSTMLARARRRAPSADFLKGDVVDIDAGDGFAVVVLAFVLHELDDETARVKALSRASEHLATEGQIAILDWALPRDGWQRRAWRRLIGMIEPLINPSSAERPYRSHNRNAPNVSNDTTNQPIAATSIHPLARPSHSRSASDCGR